MRLAYTIKEVCELTSLGRTTIYEHIGRGELLARKVNGRTLVLAQDLTQFLESLPPLMQSSRRDGSS